MCESLTLRIPTRIVRHGYRLIYVVHGVQMQQNLILKTATVIPVNLRQNSIDVKLFVDQDPSDGSGFLLMKAWLNSVKVSVNSNTSSLPSVRVCGH